MSNHTKDIARKFFAALSAGNLPDDLFTQDMRAWTASAGEWNEKAKYQGGVQMLASAFEDGLSYTVESLTAEDDRVAAAVRSEGTLVNGEAFANDYLFLLHIREDRIAAVREFFAAKPVQEQLMPVLQKIMAQRSH